MRGKKKTKTHIKTGRKAEIYNQEGTHNAQLLPEEIRVYN